MRPIFLALMISAATIFPPQAQAGGPFRTYHYGHGYGYGHGGYYGNCYNGYCYPAYQKAAEQVTKAYNEDKTNWRTAAVNAKFSLEKAELDAKDFETAMGSLHWKRGEGAVGGYHPIAEQGSTIYGSYYRGRNEPPQAFSFGDANPINEQVIFQYAADLAKMQQAATSEGHALFSARLGEKAAQNAEVQKLQTILKALPGLVESTVAPEGGTFQKRLDVVAKTETKSTFQAAPAAATDGAQSLLNAKCVACHGAGSGRMDLTNWAALKPEAKREVRKRIWHDDPDQRMPLKKQGEAYAPGERLSAEEMELLF